MNASDSLNGTDRAPLYKQPEDLFNPFVALIGAIQSFGALTIGLVALTATEALITLAVFPKPLAFGFAIIAGHRPRLSREVGR